jgi:hypothetical protein
MLAVKRRQLGDVHFDRSSSGKDLLLSLREFLHTLERFLFRDDRTARTLKL